MINQDLIVQPEDKITATIEARGELVFCRVTLECIDFSSGFFKKLKAFVGDFRIEQQQIDDMGFGNRLGVMTISFFTDKVQFKEGEKRIVTLEAKVEENKDWNFTTIEKA